MFRMKNDRDFAKIHIEYDSYNEKQKMAVVEGDEVTIASTIGALIHNLLESGFDREILEYAISKALNDSYKTRKKDVHVHEIHISKENEKEFAQILDKILKGDK